MVPKSQNSFRNVSNHWKTEQNDGHLVNHWKKEQTSTNQISNVFGILALLLFFMVFWFYQNCASIVKNLKNNIV